MIPVCLSTSDHYNYMLKSSGLTPVPYSYIVAGEISRNRKEKEELATSTYIIVIINSY